MKSISTVFVAASMAFLSMMQGCTPIMSLSPERAQAFDPKYQVVKDGHGMLLLQVAGNVWKDSHYRDMSLTVHSNTEDKDYELRSKSNVTANVALFMESLPPGTYHIQRINAAGLIASLDKQTASFTVQTDRIADLGALVLSFDSVGYSAGTFHVGSQRVLKESQQIVGLMPLPLQQRLHASELEWQPITNQGTFNRELLFKARYAAAVRAIPRGMPDRKVAIGRALGRVSVWSPQNRRWAELDTGMVASVHTVWPKSDGSVVIGLDSGMLMSWTNDAWARVDPPADGGAPILLDCHPTWGCWSVFDDGQGISVYRSDSESFGNWQLIQRIATGRQVSSVYPFPLLIPSLTKDRLYIQINAHLFVINLNGGQLETINYPNPHHARVPLKVSWDGTLFTTSGSMFSRTMYKSQDGGKTWSEQDAPNWTLDLIPASERTIYATHMDHMGMTAGGTELSLHRSDDGGKTWRQTCAQLPKYMVLLQVLENSDHLIFADIAGNIFHSTDSGATWQPVE